MFYLESYCFFSSSTTLTAEFDLIIKTMTYNFILDLNIMLSYAMCGQKGVFDFRVLGLKFAIFWSFGWDKTEYTKGV